MVYLIIEAHKVLKTCTEKVGKILSCFMVFKNFKKNAKSGDFAELGFVLDC